MGGMFHHRSTKVVTQAPFPRTIAAPFSPVFEAMALVTWLCVWSVTFVELCPRRSATTFGCSPATILVTSEGGPRAAQVMEAQPGEWCQRMYPVVGGLLS